LSSSDFASLISLSFFLYSISVSFLAISSISSDVALSYLISSSSIFFALAVSFPDNKFVFSPIAKPVVGFKESPICEVPSETVVD